ncbi:MAG: DUF951 domain-containing protein [Clostridiaceae bacterium]|jgi:hypothetical protein|nr:DUF951 domain-containing protein [Eubacteriales bacterium]NLV47603.1 DUF951 domain-containing protein [Clostridiaceae bacterium]
MPGRFHLYPFKAGETVHLKKVHPCGGHLWLIERAGSDVALRCLTCGHRIVMPRQKLEKSIQQVIQRDQTEQPRQIRS